MLHTINQSPYRTNSLETSLRFIQKGDPVLFMENGVYAVSAGGKFNKTISDLLKTNPVYALGPDLKARGIGGVVAKVQEVDYEGFVELVEQHQVNSWL